MDDYYKTLGVSRHAESEVIAAAYKAMMRKYHPDTNDRNESTNRSQAINEAYATLRSPEKRKLYDSAQQSQDTGKGGATPPPSPPGKSESSARPAGAPALRKGDSVGIGMVFLAAIGVAIFAAQGENESLANAGTADESSQPLATAATGLETGPGFGDPGNNEETIPTIGEFLDNIGTAVDHFSAILVKDGMTGAEAYSRECGRTAQVVKDILKTDYCVAFDMAAMATDVVAASSLRMPQNHYFSMRAGELDNDYSRFQQADPGRTQLIWGEVNSVLENSIEAAHSH